MDHLKRHLGLIVIIAISFFAIKPLFTKEYFPVHDSLQVERVYEITQALKDAYFPVRWVKDLGYGYGYPLFNFYAPLPYYFGSIFYFLGLNLVTATKIMFGAGILLAGISMYMLAREIWGLWGGILSALLYQYLPYHAVQIYVRGSVGEYWVYALLPLLALSILELNKALLKRWRFQKGFKWIIISGIISAAIILSHNISGMLITALLIITTILHSIVVICRKSSMQTIYALLSVILLALGLSAFFWLPAFFEKDLTKVSEVVQGGSYFADHFVTLRQLWNSPWGYGGSAPPSEIDGMSFKLGKIHAILALISLAIIYLRRQKTTNYQLLIVNYLFILLGLSIFMMLPVSTPIWRLFPILEYIQFPWRFLMYAGFSLSLLGGGAFYIMKKTSYLIKSVIILLLLFLVIMNLRALPNKIEIGYFKPSEFYIANESDFINDNNLKWEDSKRSDEYLPKNFAALKDQNEIALSRISSEYSNNVQITTDKTHVFAFRSNFSDQQALPINIASFPGWQAYIDGEPTKMQILPRGFSLKVPPGKHAVVIKFENTSVRAIGNLITILTLVFIGIIYVSRYRNSSL